MFFHNYQTKLQQDVENSRNVKINKLWENLYAELKHIPNKCATVTSNIVLFIVVMAPRSSVRPRNTLNWYAAAQASIANVLWSFELTLGQSLLAHMRVEFPFRYFPFSS